MVYDGLISPPFGAFLLPRISRGCIPLVSATAAVASHRTHQRLHGILGIGTTSLFAGIWRFYAVIFSRDFIYTR